MGAGAVPELVEGPTAARHSGLAFASFRASPGISPVNVLNAPFRTYFPVFGQNMCESGRITHISPVWAKKCAKPRVFAHLFGRGAPCRPSREQNARPCSRNYRDGSSAGKAVFEDEIGRGDAA